MIDTTKILIEDRYSILRNAEVVDSLLEYEQDSEYWDSFLAGLTPEEAFVHWINWKMGGSWGEYLVEKLHYFQAAQVAE